MGAMDVPPAPELSRAVVDAFCFEGDLVRTDPLPGGHIHHNLLVTCTGGRYVLQRLNDRVFREIDAVLSNVERVVAHLRVAGRVGPELVESCRGALSVRADDGSTWRAFHYLEGTVGRETPTGPSDAYEAAHAFADFQVALADLPGPPLVETIAPFHDLGHRLDACEAVAASDPTGRRSDAQRELDLALRLGRQVADELAEVGEGAPVRIVHNDAKLANVRFDAGTGRATCVVDLDTTMPGRARYDVGELVRTATTHAPEDAPDPASVDFDLELLEAVAAGYFAARPGLEPGEVDTMALAGPAMAVENALRFLADHLGGDHYFAVHRAGHNLDRCRTQLRLTELMLEAQADSQACFTRAARHAAPRGRRHEAPVEDLL
jgi:Ser/Thr protein kinase RdoA (MazF antagonist)